MSFICPVSMQIPSAEHYERDLKQRLIELGYTENEYKWGEDQKWLLAEFGINPNKIGFNQEEASNPSYTIDHYNPQLFLALAAMTDNEKGAEGEYYYCISWKGEMFKEGNIYPIIKGRLVNGEHKTTPPFYRFRKATKEEIIEHFSKLLRLITDLKEEEAIHCPTEEEAIAICKLMHEAGKKWINGESYLEFNNWDCYKKDTVYFPNQGTYANIYYANKNNCTIFPAKDFLPKSFYKNIKKRLLSRSNYIRMYNSACPEWKKDLSEKFKDFAIVNELEVDETYYQRMREAATKDQNILLDDIFGKDTKEVDLSNLDDSINPYKEYLEIRTGGNFKNKGFFLHPDYNWEIVTDDNNAKVLVPTLK